MKLVWDCVLYLQEPCLPMGRVVIKGGKESDIEVFGFVLRISIGQLDR